MTSRIISYSPKVFLPLTKLCRDLCHYCTFSRPRPGELKIPLATGIAGQGSVTVMGAAIVAWLIGFISDLSGTSDTYVSFQTGMLVTLPIGFIGAFFYWLAARNIGLVKSEHASHHTSTVSILFDEQQI